MTFTADVRNHTVSAIKGLMKEQWRERLKAALEESGRSAREVSLAAGRAHGYVYSLINEDKDPTISNLAAVCKILNVSVPYILHGINVTPGQVDLLELLEGAAPETVQSIRQLLSKSGG